MRWRGLLLLAVLGGLALLVGLGVHETGPDAPVVREGPAEDDAPASVHLAGRGEAPREEAKAASETTDAAAARGLTLIVVGGGEETPVANARIVVRDMAARVLAEGVTDTRGRLTWHDLTWASGRATVDARGHGRKHRYVSARAGRHTEERIVLPPAVTYRGVVVDAASDRPIPGAVVRLVSVVDRGMSKDSHLLLEEAWDQTLTNARGAFAFEGCGDDPLFAAPGLVVSAAGYAPTTKIVCKVEALLEGRGAVIGLVPAGRVAGRLVGPDGEGVAGEVRATLACTAGLLEKASNRHVLPPGSSRFEGFGVRVEDLEDIYGIRRLEADETGRFAFEDLPLGEEVVLLGRAAGLRTQRETLRVTMESEGVVLHVPRPGRVVVTVRGQDGRPIGETYVRWTRYPSPESRYHVIEQAQGRTDERGRAVFEAVTPGPCGITIWGGGIRQRHERRILEPDGVLEVAFEAEPWPPPPTPGGDSSTPDEEAAEDARESVLLHVVLELPEGAPLPKRFTVDFGNGGLSRGSWPEDGRRRLQLDHEIPAGRCKRVWVQVTGYLEQSWDVPEGASGRVVVPLQPLDPGLAVVGRVLDTSGAPVEGARVGLKTVRSDDHAYGTGTIRRRGLTDEHGRFRLEALPAGSHLLGVEVPWHQHAAKVEVRAGMRPLTVTLPRRAVVHGRAQFPEGLPAPREDVSIRPAYGPLGGDPTWQGRTDRAGRFRAEIPGGTWRVQVDRQAEDRQRKVVSTTEFEVEAGGEAEVVLSVPHSE